MNNSNLPLPLRIISEFVRLEASSGILLFITAVLALLIANSPYAHFYEYFLDAQHHIQLWHWSLNFTLVLLINDLLMAVFFLLVALEIKREILTGALNSFSKISLPALAAVGGMVAPALVYLIFNHQDPVAAHGWAIPTATDIAFALGIMALAGKRVPLELKLFLMTLAIFDDMGAIAIIAVFYSGVIHASGILGAVLCVLVLGWMNHKKVNHLAGYVIVGLVLWVEMLLSGLHPTLAGVLLAAFIPIRMNKNRCAQQADVDTDGVMVTHSPLQRMENSLHPWVAYLILPIFSFANAGVSFAGADVSHLLSAVPLGILLGLFIGKQLGIFLTTGLAIRLRWAPMPLGSNWLMLYATSIICGVGFTMSLFIGQLAFPSTEASYPVLVRFGVLLGSLLSGVVGFTFLWYGSRKA